MHYVFVLYDIYIYIYIKFDCKLGFSWARETLDKVGGNQFQEQ